MLFTKHPSNQTVSQGNAARLGCAVQGVSEPDIVWMKDGEKLYSTDQMFITLGEQHWETYHRFINTSINTSINGSRRESKEYQRRSKRCLSFKRVKRVKNNIKSGGRSVCLLCLMVQQTFTVNTGERLLLLLHLLSSSYTSLTPSLLLLLLPHTSFTPATPPSH